MSSWIFPGRAHVAAIAVAGACLALSFAESLAAAEPPDRPFLVVETGMHTGLIHRLVVDAPRHRLITCSDDKTVRIWQMPDLRLISTLRVPIDLGHEGQLFAIAISPDGKTLAAGGWTGWDWDGASSIYLFDVTSGELSRRVPGFKHAISTLNWTNDGKSLIVGLQGRAGLHLLRLSDLRILASDTEYNDKIMDVDVRPDGLIAVVALDGRVRLYDQNLSIGGRHLIDGGRTPSTVRFSPDGSLLAIGFIDAPGYIGDPTIIVANTRDLSVAYRPDLSNVKQQTGFTSLAWSSDGRYLYAGGEYRGAGANPLYRWGEAGRAVAERIPLVDNRITEIQQMPNGAIGFAAEDPVIGVIGPDTKLVAFRGPDVIDFSDANSDFAASDDGALIQYPLRRGGEKQTFSPKRGGDQVLSQAPTEAVFPPLLNVEGISIENRDPFAPTINGKQLDPKLNDFEKVRSYAIAPDRKSVLLGTEWALRRLDIEAKQKWLVPLPAVVRAVNVSRNGNLVIAALSDGTFHWYDMKNGNELLAYFPHKNGQEWICWVPDGYYTSSVNGDNFVGWHLNSGPDLTPDFYRAVQFERILYRPGVVQAVFQTAADKIATDSKPAREPGFKIGELRENAPPRLKLQTRVTAGVDGRPRLILQVHGEKNGRDIEDVVVFVNNIPVTPSNERRLSGQDVKHFVRDWEIDLFSRSNDIRVESFNGFSMGVAQSHVGLPETTEVRVKGNLYVLAVGVNVFPGLGKAMQLLYAADDAVDMAHTLQIRGKTHFNNVLSLVLSDKSQTKPTREAIVTSLAFLRKAQANDTIIVFLASHGMSDLTGNYYFLPSDVQLKDMEGLSTPDKAASLIPWTTFFEALRGVPGRRLLIVDTCEARGIEGRFDAHSLKKRSAASQFALLVAAKGGENSQAFSAGKHGLFTYALINALAADSDTSGDGLVSVREVFVAADSIVKKLRKEPQTPDILAPPPLDDVPLMAIH